MNRQSLQCRLHALAWAALGKLPGTPAGPVTAAATHGGLTLTLTVRPAGHGPGVVNPLVPFLFSPLEQLLLGALGGGTLKGAALAKRLGRTDATGQASQDVREALKNLVGRHVLENTEAGYRLGAEFRALARDLPGLLDGAAPPTG